MVISIVIKFLGSNSLVTLIHDRDDDDKKVLIKFSVYTVLHSNGLLPFYAVAVLAMKVMFYY
jgi:hypothetical protein